MVASTPEQFGKNWLIHVPAIRAYMRLSPLSHGAMVGIRHSRRFDAGYKESWLNRELGVRYLVGINSGVSPFYYFISPAAARGPVPARHWKRWVVAQSPCSV